MSDYLREIIYLQKMEKGEMKGGEGSVRLERKRGIWQLRLIAKVESSGSPMPIYMVYEKNGDFFPVLCGRTDELNQGNLRIAEEKLRGKPEKGRLCGILIGEGGKYLSGTCAGCQGELLYETLIFPEKTLRESREREMEMKEPVKEPEVQVEEEEPVKEPEVQVEEEGPVKETEGQAKEEEPEKGEALLYQRLSEMYPFEDDEMDWCRQMEPADFSAFPMSYWHYAKNSFLLHGFYNYRHLLYAEAKGKKYIGVPGQFHRREQYLASRFGFSRFKGTKKKKVTLGDFGYWLKEV